MRLRILGSCGTFPSAGGACAGYLLEHEGFHLYIDAGTGTLSRLQEHIALRDVDAIVLSHMHADHFVDVYPLFYGLWFDESGRRGIPAVAPHGSVEFLSFALGGSKDDFAKAFAWRESGPGECFTIGPFDLELFDAEHSAPNITMRFSAGGKVFCYSGDTGPNPWLREAARDADLFLCESSWQRDTSALPMPIHLRAHEAGEAARGAGASRLMLTHIWPTLDEERSRVEASETFGAEAELAMRVGVTEV